MVAHPHPLYGGTMHNKVVQTLTRALVQAGWEVVRFNFVGSAPARASTMGAVVRRKTCLQVVRQVAPTRCGGPGGFFVWRFCDHAMWCKHCGSQGACRKWYWWALRPAV